MKLDRHPSLIVAEKVLSLMRKRIAGFKLANGYADVRGYVNGREHGWAVTLVSHEEKQTKRGTVIFAEYRCSDQIVVYRSKDWYLGKISGAMYEDKEMFRTPADAADFCVKFLKECVA